MTWQTIIDTVRGLIQELDPLNSHVTDPELLGFGVECLTQLYSFIGTYPQVTTTGVTTASTVNLPGGLLKLNYASFTLPSGRKQPLARKDLANFVLANPDWENTPAGMPTTLVRMTSTGWMMYPTPSAEYTGLAMTLLGVTLPDTPTSTAQEPEISVVLHSCIPHYMAWKAFLKINDKESAGKSYAMFDSLRQMNTRTATNTSGSLQRFTVQ